MLIALLKKAYFTLEYTLRHHSLFRTNTGHKKLFFPCCSLTEGDPDLSLEVFDYLRKQESDIGVWQDCCGMPLVYNKATKAAEKAGNAILQTVQKQGITELITPCTTCHQRFQKLFQTMTQPPKVTFLYDRLEKNLALQKRDNQNLVVHHPCPARGTVELQHSFSELCKRLNLKIEPASTQEHPLNCCLVKTESSREKIKKQKSNRIITYCAHCVQQFESQLDIVHVLELLFTTDKPIKKTSFFTKLMHARKFKKQVSQMNRTTV